MKRHAERLDLVPPERRDEALELAARLVRDEDLDETRAVFDAVRAILRPPPRRIPSAVGSPEVSIRVGRPKE